MTKADRRYLRAMWKRACRYDGVGTDLKGKHRYEDCVFVVFTDENPWAIAHGLKMRDMLGDRR